jgi:hypothetical protein
VSYADSRVTTLALLYEGKDRGLFKVLDPIAPEILQRIREAALQSVRMPLENADVLMNQRLVDL